MENQVQSEQANLLRQEAEGVKNVAFELRSSIKSVAAYNTNVPTAGVVDNLINLVNVWENQQVDQLTSQLAELEPCLQA
ncbi:hypothetical protein EXU85_20570 [Spirosoma sp. KCTC 42546]|uniref:hypothetical protein n=1 Tax=Spirosoma sp. KCTC 42546 TaxID=2520506 RepID=UPI0011591A32|nr:hypothetical protein [Spirosoma sp. KCTC 42546]QDK80875.1 hypothetical protein EXU85_20570 [Spirosoma sp. KCTC 42546]